MSKRTDSNGYTMVFAVIMVFVVGSLLAFLASSLKPAIKENERIEKQQNILYAMGVNEILFWLFLTDHHCGNKHKWFHLCQ